MGLRVQTKFKYLLITTGSFIVGCFLTLSVVNVQDKMQLNNNTALYLQNSNGKLFNSINYFLIIMIISSVDNVIQRNAIRETWGLLNSEYSDVKYFFIVGGNSLQHDQLQEVRKEQIKYNDMFILSVPDTYGFLTKKVLKAILWFETEFNYKYILKCDDDSFVVIPRVVQNLKYTLSKHNHLYWGYFNGKAHVQLSGKWKDSSWFLCDRYLPYSLGGGYVLSRSLTQYIKTNKALLSTYVSEDVSVGAWLAPLNITRFHDVRFDTEHLSRGCNNSYIVTHKQSPDDMKRLYNNLVNTGNLCSKEITTRLSYEYNWKVPPTKCCAIEWMY